MFGEVDDRKGALRNAPTSGQRKIDIDDRTCCVAHHLRPNGKPQGLGEIGAKHVKVGAGVDGERELVPADVRAHDRQGQRAFRAEE